MSQMKNPGPALALGSALAYCSLNIGVRYVLDTEDLTVWGLLLVRGLVAIPAAAILAALYKKGPVLGHDRKLLLLIGFCSFASTVCTTLAINLLPLYQALVLLYLYPALSVPLGFFINGERAGRDGLALVAVAFVGCLLLLWPNEAAGLKLGPGHLAGLLCAVFYALAYVLARRLSADHSGLEPIFYYGCWAVAGNLFVILILDQPTGLTVTRTLLPGLGLAALAVAGLLAGYAALKWLPPFQVGVIGTLEIFGGVLASWLLFGDPFTSRAMVGGALILAAALKIRRG